MNISINLDEYTTEAVRGIAYAIANGGPEMRLSSLESRAHQQLRDIISLLDSRARGGDTSELKEMADRWGKGLESRRTKPMFTGRKMLGPKSAKARRFDAQYDAAKLAIEADDRRRAARKSGAGAPGSLDTRLSPAERDALRTKEQALHSYHITIMINGQPGEIVVQAPSEADAIELAISQLPKRKRLQAENAEISVVRI